MMRASRTVRWLLAIGYAGGIYVLSASSGVSAPGGMEGLDKVAHAVEYGGFTAVLAFALRAGGSPFVVTRAALLAVLYGVTDEYHQHLVPGRESAIADVVADGVGALLVGGLLAYRWRHTMAEGADKQQLSS